MTAPTTGGTPKRKRRPGRGGEIAKTSRSKTKHSSLASPNVSGNQWRRAMNAAAELAAALGGEHREGKEWKCLCPSHPGSQPVA